MNVSVRGENMRVSDNLKEYAVEKVNKLDRYLPNITDIRVDLSRQHTKRGEDLTIAQITLRHHRGAILRAEEKLAGEDDEAVQAAINTAIDKLYRQIDRFKGKRRDRKRRSKDIERFVATPEELELAEEVPEYDEIAADYPITEADETDILRRKAVALVAMSEDEAIEQMELLDHSFFMFLNGETGDVNVLYRRANGGYGVLIPAS